MEKLYQRLKGVLHYHEAWVHDGRVYEHWGRAGELGKTVHRPLLEGMTPEAAIERVLEPVRHRGFQPMEVVVLVVEYAIGEAGDEADLAKRHAVEDRLNYTLGWTGLGACDGGSIGSGTMEIFCHVVDFQLAQEVVSGDLAQNGFGDFLRIYLGETS